MNYVEVIRGGVPIGSPFGKISGLRLRRGDLVRLVTGTGGGYGDPRERAADLVRADLRDEIITAREAYEAYGVRAHEESGHSA